MGAQGRRSDIVRGSDEVKPTVPEIGIPRQRASEMKRLAEAGEEAIRDEVRRATEEGRAVWRPGAGAMVAGENGRACGRLAQPPNAAQPVWEKIWENPAADPANPLKRLASPRGFEPLLPP